MTAVLLPRQLGGTFAQRAHSSSYYGVYPGNTPENHPPPEVCMISPGPKYFLTWGPILAPAPNQGQ